MRRWRCVVAAAAVAAIGRAPDVAAQAPAPGAAYDIDRSQSVQNAPAGSVGRKTTDRERRVGKTKDTAGKEVNYVLTFGGFARRCPTAEGIVEGDFEYTLTYSEVVSAGGVTQQTHQARRLLARLKGHVGDDARLERVEMEGDFTVEKSGTGVPPSSERRPVRTTFRPGGGGEPDFDAMRTAVEATADVAVASVVLGAGTVYRQAEIEWLKKNACVEFEFDPPSDERRVGPNQATQVRTGLRTKEGRAPVAFNTDHIGVLDGAGSVSPRSVQAQAGERPALTYTASARPRRGHGIDIATLSRAGLADGQWRILDLGKFEGSFTQTDTADLASGLGGGTEIQKVTGKLVWTPEEAKTPAAPSFGDVRSTFFRPTSGDITVDLQYDFRGFGGSACKQQARKSFPIASLPENLLRFLWIEIAEDGRYKLSLGLPDRVWQVWSMEAEAVCTFPGGNVSRDSVRVNEVAVQLGVHQGTLKDDQSIAGELPAPIRRGQRVITGNWSFTMKSD